MGVSLGNDEIFGGVTVPFLAEDFDAELEEREVREIFCGSDDAILRDTACSDELDEVFRILFGLAELESHTLSSEVAESARCGINRDTDTGAEGKFWPMECASVLMEEHPESKDAEKR